MPQPAPNLEDISTATAQPAEREAEPSGGGFFGGWFGGKKKGAEDSGGGSGGGFSEEFTPAPQFR